MTKEEKVKRIKNKCGLLLNSTDIDIEKIRFIIPDFKDFEDGMMTIIKGGEIFLFIGKDVAEKDEKEWIATLAHEMGHIIYYPSDNRKYFDHRIFKFFFRWKKAKDFINWHQELFGLITGYSLRNELAADRIGIKLLEGVGYSPYLLLDQAEWAYKDNKRNLLDCTWYHAIWGIHIGRERIKNIKRILRR